MLIKQILFFVVASLAMSCSMQRVPASVGRNPVPVITETFSSCEWRSLPETKTDLLPTVKTITCELVSSLSPEAMEFSLTRSLGKTQTKHSKKFTDSFYLETGEYGANYYLEYGPKKDARECIGRWCGWSSAAKPPTTEQLLPNEEGNVHVKSDGGLAYRILWKTDRPIRGLAFVYCGLGGLQHASKILGNELLENGWAIVYVYTVLNAPKFQTNILLIEENAAEEIVRLFDKKYCQVITATKSIRQIVEEKIPQVQSLPLVLLGISAGALNTPAVYHELQNEVDAVVLIAGGANMFEIVRNGAFTKWNFSKMFTPYIDDREYLATPSRDPYFLAPELPENTLLVHARWDKIVPAKNGDLLWERAGKPERWVFSGGHLGLFMTFDWHADDIVEWIDEKITRPRR
ncbi:MAG: alpha/beta hydrolase [Planctomycetes bacterium]|nr:alpha/beta hydrolase [Planctomycetota bacterium]